MYLDNAPLIGFDGLGEYLTQAKTDAANRYNAAAVNTKFTLPTAPALFANYTPTGLTHIISVYQKKNGLFVDGKLGPLTAAALQREARNLKSPIDSDGEIVAEVDDSIQETNEAGEYAEGTWLHAFESDTLPTEENYALGLRIFSGIKKVKPPSGVKLPKPKPKPVPIPQPMQAGGNSVYLVAGGVLLFLAYRSFTGKPLNPFSK